MVKVKVDLKSFNSFKTKGKANISLETCIGIMYSDQAIEDFNDLKNRTCILPISVGQAYHEKELFKATVEALMPIFKNFIIVVADSLQAHNWVTKNQKLDTLIPKAVSEGEKWIQENKETTDMLTKTGKLVKTFRWDDLKNQPAFLERLQLYHERYQRGFEDFNAHPIELDDVAKNPDRTFFLQVDSTVQKISFRSKKYDRDSLLAKNTLNYIIEETVIFSFFCENYFWLENADVVQPVHAYPGKLNQSMYYELSLKNADNEQYAYKTLTPIEIIIDTHKIKNQYEIPQNISSGQEVRSDSDVTQTDNQEIMFCPNTLQTNYWLNNSNKNTVNNENLTPCVRFDKRLLKKHLKFFMTEAILLNGMLTSFSQLLDEKPANSEMESQILQLDRLLLNKMSTNKSKAQPQSREHFPTEAKLAINKTQQYETNHTI